MTHVPEVFPVSMPCLLAAPRPSCTAGGPFLPVLPPPVLTGRLRSCRGPGIGYDSVLRREAWEAAHPGGEFSFDAEGLCTWSHDGKPFRGPHIPGILMDFLDDDEARGLCPLHGPFAGTRP